MSQKEKKKKQQKFELNSTNKAAIYIGTWLTILYGNKNDLWKAKTIVNGDKPNENEVNSRLYHCGEIDGIVNNLNKVKGNSIVVINLPNEFWSSQSKNSFK